MNSKDSKQLFSRPNYPVFFSFILLTIINFTYVISEINKPNILKSMGYNITESSVYKVSLQEIERITSVSDFSMYFEITFIIISLFLIIFLLTKRVRPFFTKLVIMILCFFLCLFIINTGLAAIFEVPQVNLTQLLILPFQFLVIIFLYGLIKFRKQPQ